MLQKMTIIFFIFISTVFAKDTISIEAILQSNYDANISVHKKSLILTKEEAKEIQKQAKSKLSSKIVRYYAVKKENSIIGHAILLRQKIRTKNAAILYMVDANKTMIAIEIISFKEPSEYKPNSTWKEIFVGKTTEDTLVAGKDIATISGATISARAISNAARLALAIATKKL
jgi:Na+-translocating ferredoxin:NAD+ oxidoreductase RnfG subunit